VTREAAATGTCALVLLALAACTAPQPSPRAAPPPEPGAPAASPPAAAPAAPAESADANARLRQQGARATQLFHDGRYAEADALFTTIIADPQFGALPTRLQHTALQLAGGLAMQMRDPRRALALLRRACDMSEATGVDWVARLQAANFAGDERDVVASLTILAVRWPDQLPHLEKTEDLDYAMRSVQKLGSDADRYTVLSALFDARLSRQHDGDSEWWRDLALLRLARGEHAGAAATLPRIKAAYTVVSIEADQRFDSLRRLRDPWPSVADVASSAIEAADRRVQEDPGELEPMDRLARLLGNSLHFAEELQVADAAIERIEAEGPQVYSDYGREYAWILDRRADALYGLGRWDAAVIQMRAASELSEQGSPNVSQLINLADMYAELERPTDSRMVIAQVESRPASPFGEMQKKLVALYAAVQLHDTRTVREALTFLRQHRDDAPGALQEALLVSGHDDECAQLLISRLADPRTRGEALLAVQDYDAQARPPWLEEKHRHWRAIIQRRDVAAAIARVGRVGHYPLDQPGY
jgi:tetratricopeptide (TPR) repeat protein